MPSRAGEDAKRDVISTLVKTVRLDAGLTQVQLADRLGQAQSVVSKLESGERRLELGELISICEACGIRIVDFAARLQTSLEKISAS